MVTACMKNLFFWCSHSRNSEVYLFSISRDTKIPIAEKQYVQLSVDSHVYRMRQVSSILSLAQYKAEAKAQQQQ